MHPHEHLHGLVPRRWLHGDARPQPREWIRARPRRRGAAAPSPADGDGAEELKPLGGGHGLAPPGYVEPSLLQEGNQRGEHLERREVHVLDDDPTSARDSLGQRPGLPPELSGRGSDDVRPEQRLGIRLRVQVEDDEIFVARERCHLLEHRALTRARGALQEQGLVPAQRERHRAEVPRGAPGADHRRRRAVFRRRHSCAHSNLDAPHAHVSRRGG